MTKIEKAVFGKPEDMIAEYAAFDLNTACDTKHRYYGMLLADCDYDTVGFANLTEARAWAKEVAEYYGCKSHRLS